MAVATDLNALAAALVNPDDRGILPVRRVHIGGEDLVVPWDHIVEMNLAEGVGGGGAIQVRVVSARRIRNQRRRHPGGRSPGGIGDLYIQRAGLEAHGDVESACLGLCADVNRSVEGLVGAKTSGGGRE